MILIDSIRSFFFPASFDEPEVIVPAPPGKYTIKPLTINHLDEVSRLNIRCFRNGDNYTKYTFDHLLTRPDTLSYRVVDSKGEMTAFATLIVSENGSAHLTTIGVAPEHRKRGLASLLLSHIEAALIRREITSVMLEVRVGNTDAQSLYRKLGYYVVQRLNKYYANGEDCFLMVKAIFPAL